MILYFSSITRIRNNEKVGKKITTQNARTFTYVGILGEYKYVGLSFDKKNV